MEEETDENETEGQKSFLSKVLWVIVGLFFLFFIVHYGIKTFRNNDHRDLSERFIRGNAIVRDEAGEIIRIGGGQARLIGVGEWEVSRSVTGTRKKLLLTVSMHCRQDSTDVGAGCTIKRAAYKGDAPSDVEQEIPISWYDNFTIVYR